MMLERLTQTVARLGSVVFLHDPSGHATLILDDGGLQRVQKLTAQFCGEFD